MHTKKAVLNVTMSLLSQIVTLICGLILPRMILSYFGSTYNGLTNSIIQFLSWVTLLRAGVGGVTRASLYKPLHNKDYKKISGIIKATKLFMRKISILIALLIICFGLIFPFFIKDEFEWFFTFSLVLIIGLSTFMQNLFGITSQILIQSDQREYINSIITILVTILNVVVAYILLKSGFGIHIIKLGSSLVFCLNPLFLCIYVNKKYKLDKSATSDNSALSQRWDAFAQQFATMVYNNTDMIILTIFASLVDVSIYSVYLLVINGIWRLVTSLSFGLDGVIGDIYANGNLNDTNRKFSLYEFISHNINTFLFSCTIVLIIPFIKIYTKGIDDANYVNVLFGFLFVLSSWLNSSRLPYQTIAEVSGNFKRTRNGAIIEVFLNVIISIIFVNIIGMIGVIVGTICAALFRTIQYVVFSSKYVLKRNFCVGFIRIINYLFIVLLSFTLGYYLINFEINNYLQWFILALVVSFLVIIILLINDLIFYRKIMLKIFWLLYNNFKLGKNMKRLKQSLKKVFLKFLSLFIKCDNSVLFICFGGRQYSDNPKAISETLKKMDNNIKQVWVLDSTDNYDLIPNYIKKVKSGTFKFYSCFLKAKVVVTNDAWKNNIIKRKNQLFIQTWHGDREFKKILYDAWENSERPSLLLDDIVDDYCISGSLHAEQVFKTAFKYNGEILKYGTPKNDILINIDTNKTMKIKEKIGIDKNVNILIYAPTFNGDNVGNCHLTIDINSTLKCLETKTKKLWICIVRNPVLSKNTIYTHSEKIIDLSNYPDMADLLLISDFLITDYSSSAGDFVLKNKPVILTIFDKELYEKNCINFYFPLEKTGFLLANSQSELENLILNTSEEEYLKECKNVLKFYGCYETGNASSLISEKIIEFVKGEKRS